MTTPSERVLARLAEVQEACGPAERPWCKDLVYTQVRHVVRNCDCECFTHTDEAHGMFDCEGLEKYSGPALVTLRNSLPALRALIEAAEAMRGNTGNMIRANAAAAAYDAALAAYLVAIGG